MYNNLIFKMIISYKGWVKISMTTIFVAASVFCFYCEIKNPFEGEYLLTFPIIVACVYGWFYIKTFKIEIAEDFVMQSGIKKKLIKFSDVEKIELYTDQLIIKSQNTKIKITSDLEKQAEAISFVLEKLKERKKYLETKGDKNLINTFLN